MTYKVHLNSPFSTEIFRNPNLSYFRNIQETFYDINFLNEFT